MAGAKCKADRRPGKPLAGPTDNFGRGPLNVAYASCWLLVTRFDNAFRISIRTRVARVTDGLKYRPTYPSCLARDSLAPSDLNLDAKAKVFKST